MRFLKNQKNNNSKSDLMINDIDPSQKLIKNLRLKIAGTFLALFLLVSCVCETANPMMDGTSIGTNIDIARTITSNVNAEIWHQTNFISSNEENAVIHYNTGSSFTNIFFRYVLASSELSNYLSQRDMGVITTNEVITTNILSNVESSFLRTNISTTFTNVPVGFITNYFTNVEISINAITNTDWSRFDFSGANLTNLNLTNYNFSGADLNEADLRFANLSNANLSNANLSNADLRFASLINANLSSANFTNAWLNGEGYLYLRGQGIDGFEPNLTGADLQNADLSGADLMNADLSGAILLGATTNGINFTGADLTAALIDLDKTLAMDGAANDLFGVSVSVSGDTAIVGSYFDGNNNGVSSGSAYIFTRSGGTWTQQAKITPNDGAKNDQFGISVSVSGDTVIVGSVFDDDNGVSSGSAYIFTRSGTDWSQQAKITPNDGTAGDFFGYSVSLSGDTVIVGSYLDDDNGNNSGSAYIFTRSGTDWSQQAKITPNDGSADNFFGISVSLSEDTVIVGANQDDSGNNSGSAYIFTRTGGTWTQQAKITPNDGTAGDFFGYSVSLSEDTVIVGAYRDDDNGSSSGSAYIFTRSGTDWSQQAKITNNDGMAGDFFGYSVSLSGNTVIVGAYQDDDSGNNSGSAYIFTRTGGTWTQQAKITPNDGASDDQSGISVSMSGDTVIVGAYRDDDNGSSSGSAYVFEFLELP